jgi:hypothetical protein
MGECRLIIRHSAPVSDEVRGDRARRISEIFVETGIGERFLLGHTNLHGARAIARHLTEGGTMFDEIAESINKMVSEMSAMRHFVRATKSRQFEDHETASMTQSAVRHYMQLKNTLRHLANKKHYDEFKECYVPESPIEDDVDVDALRERFVKKIYDDRFNEALPIVYKAYKQQQNEAHGRVSSELEEWADVVFEGTWATPDSADKVRALVELLKTPLPVGIDGLDAADSLYNLIGDDKLADQISELATSQGPDADATPLVKVWLRDNMPAVFAQVQQSLKQNGRDAQTKFAPQTSPQQDISNEYGATAMDWPAENPVVKESDDLAFIRQLAGLK